MRPIRIALPLLLATTLAACAANAGVSASAESAAAQGSLTLLNSAEGVQAMERNYPLLLRDARVTGEVMLAVTVDAQGVVTGSSVISSTQDLFSEPAQRAAQGLRFSAPSVAGSRVRVRMAFAPDASHISVVR